MSSISHLSTGLQISVHHYPLADTVPREMALSFLCTPKMQPCYSTGAGSTIHRSQRQNSDFFNYTAERLKNNETKHIELERDKK